MGTGKCEIDSVFQCKVLIHNRFQSIKTYSRHSNGRVTYDLVNEILKDCDVPPIIGANSEPWDKIEYDGVYFFNSVNWNIKRNKGSNSC